MESEGGLVVRGRVEIDMRQPFRSVKEAISLFGEKVLAGEIYAPKLKETKLRSIDQQEKQKSISHEAARNENTETNERSNKKTNEESNLMSFYLNSLKQELEETRKELQQLKTKDKQSDHHHQEPTSLIDPEIEEIKFVENSTTRLFEVDTKTEEEEQQQQQEFELEKKRSVKFASPPLLTRMIVNKDDKEEEDKSNEFHSSSFEKKKIKRKPLIPLFGGLFSKKNGAQKTKSKSYKE